MKCLNEMWLLSASILDDLYGQCGHWHGFSPVWVSRWRARLDFLSKPRVQMSHTNQSVPGVVPRVFSGAECNCRGVNLSIWSVGYWDSAEVPTNIRCWSSEELEPLYALLRLQFDPTSNSCLFSTYNKRITAYK